MFGENRYHFSLGITKDELLRLYRSSNMRLRIISAEGIVLDVDANHLKQFTTMDGIYGNFVLVTTKSNKFVKIEKIEG